MRMRILIGILGGEDEGEVFVFSNFWNKIGHWHVSMWNRFLNARRCILDIKKKIYSSTSREINIYRLVRYYFFFQRTIILSRIELVKIDEEEGSWLAGSCTKVKFQSIERNCQEGGQFDEITRVKKKKKREKEFKDFPSSSRRNLCPSRTAI